MERLICSESWVCLLCLHLLRIMWCCINQSWDVEAIWSGKRAHSLVLRIASFVVRACSGRGYSALVLHAVGMLRTWKNTLFSLARGEASADPRLQTSPPPSRTRGGDGRIKTRFPGFPHMRLGSRIYLSIMVWRCLFCVMYVGTTLCFSK